MTVYKKIGTGNWYPLSSAQMAYVSAKIGGYRDNTITSKDTLDVNSDPSFLSVSKNFGIGVYDAGAETVIGLWNMVDTPPKQAASNLNYIFSNPKVVTKAAWNEVTTTFTKDVINGDADTRAHYVGKVTGEIALAVIGTKGIDKAVKGIRGAETVGGVAKAQAPQKVIGHYPEYIEMSSKLGTKPFSIPTNIWNKMTPAEQWAANQKFLDRAIAKSSEFNLATPIDKVRPGSYLEKEINYLISQGYKLSSDGTKLVK